MSLNKETKANQTPVSSRIQNQITPWLYHHWRDKIISKMNILGMKLKIIWLWGFNSWDLSSIEYPLISIIP